MVDKHMTGPAEQDQIVGRVVRLLSIDMMDNKRIPFSGTYAAILAFVLVAFANLFLQPWGEPRPIGDGYGAALPVRVAFADPALAVTGPPLFSFGAGEELRHAILSEAATGAIFPGARSDERGLTPSAGMIGRGVRPRLPHRIVGTTESRRTPIGLRDLSFSGFRHLIASAISIEAGIVAEFPKPTLVSLATLSTGPIVALDGRFAFGRTGVGFRFGMAGDHNGLLAKRASALDAPTSPIGILLPDLCPLPCSVTGPSTEIVGLDEGGILADPKPTMIALDGDSWHGLKVN